MLGLLPLIAFLALFVFIGNHYTNWGWRKSFLRSILLSGSYVVLLTEALSIFRGINRAILTISWLVPFFLFAGCLGDLYIHLFVRIRPFFSLFDQLPCCVL